MSETRVVTTENGHICGTHSWATGFIAVPQKACRLTEDSILAKASWLSKHVSNEAAEEYFDRAVKVLEYVLRRRNGV